MLICGCQSNDTFKEEEANIALEPYTPALHLPTNKDIETELSVPLEHKVKELPVAEPITHNANYLDDSAAYKKEASTLINKEVCRDKVKVTYRLLDKNAVKGIYHAEVQAQGVIVGISHDKKQFKIKTTGWYSHNNNLHQWQPYLKETPIAKDVLLKTGAEFWSPKDLWYLCGGLAI